MAGGRVRGAVLDVAYRQGNPRNRSGEPDSASLSHIGAVIQETSPDKGTTVFWFDAHGNVTKKVDSRSIETDFTYDALNRVLTKTFPADAAENVTYTYDATTGGNDGIGRLTGVSDQSGTTAFVYNALGQITSDGRKIGANTYTAAYTFDPAGHPLSITYPSGRIVTYTRDALGRVSGITTKQNSGATPVTVLSSGTYKPFGGFAGANFGDGTSVTIGYDQDYELTSIAATKSVQNLSLGYDPASNISGITDSLNSGRSQSFGYDDLNRLNSATGLYGAQSYTYDGVGNRTGLTVGGTTSTYAIAATANQISTVTTGSNVRTFTYAASGQATGDQRTSTTDYTYTINNDGRLSAASLNGSTVGSYLYNGFGQRVQKTAGGVTIDLVFDRFGHLIAEANDATGAMLREYVWMDDLPVAMVDDTGASPVVYYIHTDQIGSPQKVTDASGHVVWDGVFDPFGNAVTNTGANWGTGIWDAFTWEPANPQTMPLRFPGQYADTETALNQNWFRDYDPSIGRYIQSDPLGLLGGINTYEYASGGPVGYYDRDGRFLPLIVVLPLIGGLAGGLADVLAAGPCENKLSAFERGFVLGAAGTLVGIATTAGTGSPFLGGAAGGAAANAIDQSLAGTSNTSSYVISTLGGGIFSSAAAKLFPLRGFAPSLLIPRTFNNFGPNSQRLLTQEFLNDQSNTITQAVTGQNGSKPCGCQK